MTLPEFRELVADMRRAQREYFRTRSASALEASKRLEKRVDAVIREGMQGQGVLFGAEDEGGASGTNDGLDAAVAGPPRPPPR